MKLSKDEIVDEEKKRRQLTLKLGNDRRAMLRI